MTGPDTTTTPRESRPTAAGGCGCGGCGCGAGGSEETRGGTLPIVARPSRAADAPSRVDPPSAAGATPAEGGAEPGDLDLRALPPQERRARALEAVSALLPGEGVVLAAPHDPARLREVLEAEETGTLGWRYLAEGPQVWRVLVSRETCC